MFWEYPKYPDNPGSYCSDYRQEHWNCWKSHAAQCSRKQIHQSAHKISHCRIQENLHAALYYCCIRCVNPQKLRPHQIGSASHNNWDCYRQKDTVSKNFIHSFPLSNTVILTGKAHTGLCDGIYGCKQKSKNIVGSSISSHCHRTEWIYRGLQKDIRKINHRTLDSGRNSYLKNLL